MPIEKKALAAEIREFIEEHAKIRAGYDPNFHMPSERFSGPDASMMEYAADKLEQGEVPEQAIHSEWGSGAYEPWDDEEAKEWHDSILERIRELKSS